MSVKDSLHFLLTFSKSILKKIPISSGYTKTVNIAESVVPMMAAPNKL